MLIRVKIKGTQSDDLGFYRHSGCYKGKPSSVQMCSCCFLIVLVYFRNLAVLNLWFFSFLLSVFLVKILFWTVWDGARGANWVFHVLSIWSCSEVTDFIVFDVDLMTLSFRVLFLFLWFWDTHNELEFSLYFWLVLSHLPFDYVTYWDGTPFVRMFMLSFVLGQYLTTEVTYVISSFSFSYLRRLNW